jgi:type IV pilus assembly protein PilA
VGKLRLHTGRAGRGFTLIELMIVVVIMGVLASVAVLAYRTYIRRARVSEAAGLLAGLKASQESYRSEFGMYCNVNAPAPGEAPRSVGRAWDPLLINPRWTQLGFRPDSQIVMFQLDTVAGLPGTATPGGWVGGADGAGLPVDVGEFTQDHWFIGRAFGNQDNDAVNSVFWVTNMAANVGFAREVE